MQIVLATGIYPPQIGGIATYAEKLAEGLAGTGHEVRVVTYGSGKWKVESGKWPVFYVDQSGGIFSRWRRYAKALKEVGADADVVIALSSVSVGIPLMMSGLKKPKRILRLGGDFFWERYTDAGGMKSLREWYAGDFAFWKMINTAFMEAILLSFDHLIYSTDFQREIHQSAFSRLPESRIIENAQPALTPSPSPAGRGEHSRHEPFRLLFMGRFVGFKNLLSLVDAMKDLPEVHLTLVGKGPMEQTLHERVHHLNLESSITFMPPVHDEEKQKVFAEHDLLIIPSVTEISPNVALEAISECLPVLLTEETGLSATTFPSIIRKPLRSAPQIVTAIRDVMNHYESPRYDSSVRDWKKVAMEWDSFLKQSV